MRLKILVIFSASPCHLPLSTQYQQQQKLNSYRIVTHIEYELAVTLY